MSEKPNQKEFELNDRKITPLRWMVAIDRRESPPLTGEEKYQLEKGLISNVDMLKKKTGLPLNEAEKLEQANLEETENQSKIPPFKEW